MRDKQAILAYIEAYWQKACYPNERKLPASWRNLIMQLGRIKLPHPFIAPNDDYFADTQFYWDTYFTVLGLVVSERAELARGMVDNLCFLLKKFGYIPARNSYTSLGRTQPPYLTRMAFEVYEHGGANLDWLGNVMALAQKEYEQAWNSGRRLDNVTELSRYAPRWWRRHLTVYESGWDSSARFNNTNYASLLPIDLNCQLYVYEQDFAAYAELTGDKAAQKRWQQAAQKRQKLVNQYCWDEKSGFFFDYNTQSNQREPLYTLAGFFPLWAGLASAKQAKRMVKHLAVFERSNGLASTEHLTWDNRQWDYPNGWPPLQYIVITGLRRYGFHKDAKRLATAYLKLCQTMFARTGKLWEKYDVVDGDVGRAANYPTQSGFGWTNAVYLRLLDDLDH